MKKNFLLLAIVSSISVYAQTWNLSGNSGTNPSTNFLGTTDNQPLVFKINNTEKLRITVGNRFIPQGLTGTANIWDKNLFFGGGVDNTTTTGNTVFGLGSFTLNTTGNGNTAFGNNVLGANTTGTSNTGVGLNALFSNISGIQMLLLDKAV